MDKMPITKLTMDELSDTALLTVLGAVNAHRSTLQLPMELGYPYAFWTAFDVMHGQNTCIEYFVPDSNETHIYHYRKKDGHWEWWQ